MTVPDAEVPVSPEGALAGEGATEARPPAPPRKASRAGDGVPKPWSRGKGSELLCHPELRTAPSASKPCVGSNPRAAASLPSIPAQSSARMVAAGDPPEGPFLAPLTGVRGMKILAQIPRGGDTSPNPRRDPDPRFPPGKDVLQAAAVTEVASVSRLSPR